MKVLLCVNRLADFKLLLEHIETKQQQALQPNSNPTLASYIFDTRYLQHDLTICETGFGLFQTTYKTTKVLQLQKYHLALKVGFCNAYKESIAVGE